MPADIFFQTNVLLGLLIFFQICVCILLVTLFTSHRLLHRKYENLAAHLGILQAPLFRKAQKDAINIVERATENAIDIAGQTKESADIAQNAFRKELQHFVITHLQQLETSVGGFDRAYIEALTHLKNEYLTYFSNVTKQVEEKINKDSTTWTRALEEETVSLQKEVAKRIDKEYQRVYEELQLYQKRQEEIIDQQTKERVIMLAEKALGLSLDASSQERLVTMAIEKAKEVEVLADEKQFV